MKVSVFNKLVAKRVSAFLNVLAKKDSEYSRNGDRLHNFKVAARHKGESPELALYGMFIKHLVSLEDTIRDADEMGEVPDSLVLSEKMNDCHNYLFLLEGLLEERRSS